MAESAVTESSMHTELLAQMPVSVNATTSRTVVKNSLLSQVLFSFDAGQALSEHASPKAVIVQVITGKLRFTVEGEAKDLGPGDVVYLAPHAPHALEALEATHMALTMVNVPLNLADSSCCGDSND